MSKKQLSYWLFLFSLAGIFFGCSPEDEDGHFHPLDIRNPCRVVSFIDFDYEGSPCEPSIITRNDNGYVIAISRDCYGVSYEFEYDETGNLITYRIGDFDVERIEYDDKNRMIRQEVDEFRHFTYTYKLDTIFEWNSDEELHTIYFDINELGLPGISRAIEYPSPFTDETCPGDIIYEYDNQGILIRRSLSSCMYRSFKLEYSYNNSWINPDPFPKDHFSGLGHPFLKKPKSVLQTTFSNIHGPYGDETENFEYLWYPETSELHVLKTKSYEYGPEPSSPVLIRIYNMDCE